MLITSFIWNELSGLLLNDMPLISTRAPYIRTHLSDANRLAPLEVSFFFLTISMTDKRWCWLA